jgi:hypothetical protein
MHLIEEFIPPAVQMSNRAFYLIMMKASCEYLLNLNIETSELSTPSKLDKNSMLSDLDVSLLGV